MTLPKINDRWRRIWERLSIWIVFIAVFVGVIGGAWGLTQQNDNHVLLQKSVAQSQEILSLVQTVHDAQVTNKGTLVDITALETEVASVIEGLPAADATLVKEAGGLASDLMALCQAAHANCPPLPTP